MTDQPPESPLLGLNLDLDSAANTLEVARARGLARRVVLTNGGFDLLHVGHLRLLEAARALGDVLIVALNDDASLRGLKGPGRPFVPLAERAELLCGLRAVSMVTSFSGSTAEEVLRRLRPQVHAKGTDYTEATLPEAAIDRSLGVEMAFVGDVKRHATSRLAELLADPQVQR